MTYAIRNSSNDLDVEYVATLAEAAQYLRSTDDGQARRYVVDDGERIVLTINWTYPRADDIWKLLDGDGDPFVVFAGR